MKRQYFEKRKVTTFDSKGVRVASILDEDKKVIRLSGDIKYHHERKEHFKASPGWPKGAA